MASKRETVIAAVKVLVAAALPGAEVKRNLAKAERIPPGGLVVIRQIFQDKNWAIRANRRSASRR